MSDWNSEQYLKFEKERSQPAVDLIKRIEISNPSKIIDIGCGPGNSTILLKKYFPDAEILGVDYSPNMIKKAKELHPELKFEICDASKDLISMEKDYDIVFSNACLQWIPNHYELIKNMLALLKKNGVLAVQIPINQNEPLYKIVDEAAEDKKWGFEKSNLEKAHTLKQNEYFDILSEFASDFSIWETVYYHRMKSHQDLLEWVKITKMRPYEDLLNTHEQKEAFESEVLQRVSKAYSVQKNSEIIFKFRRLFFKATP